MVRCREWVWLHLHPHTKSGCSGLTISAAPYDPQQLSQYQRQVQLELLFSSLALLREFYFVPPLPRPGTEGDRGGRWLARYSRRVCRCAWLAGRLQPVDLLAMLFVVSIAVTLFHIFKPHFLTLI